MRVVLKSNCLVAFQQKAYLSPLSRPTITNGLEALSYYLKLIRSLVKELISKKEKRIEDFFLLFFCIKKKHIFLHSCVDNYITRFVVLFNLYLTQLIHHIFHKHKLHKKTRIIVPFSTITKVNLTSYKI